MARRSGPPLIRRAEDPNHTSKSLRPQPSAAEAALPRSPATDNRMHPRHIIRTAIRGAHQGGHAMTRLLRRVLRRVLETAFEKVLRRVLRRCLAVGFRGRRRVLRRILRRCSKKGLSRST